MPTPETAASPVSGAAVLAPDNLVAWCIVPFDAAQRGPRQRAQMLADLGIDRCAYDWRAKHVAEFEEEFLAYQRHGIELFAFWGEHDEAYRLFEKLDLHPQIWLMPPNPAEGDQAEKVRAAAQALLPAAERTKRLGCKLALYNHGGWGGEPENLVAVCRELRRRGFDHVGITYNFHHGHDHIDDWPALLAAMLPYLHCVNLNGMNPGAQPKILGISKGEHELAMIRTLVRSGYDGPVGILDHRNNLDARESLQENLAGLRWVRTELIAPGTAGPKPPAPASYQPPKPAKPPETADQSNDSAEDRIPSSDDGNQSSGERNRSPGDGGRAGGEVNLSSAAGRPATVESGSPPEDPRYVAALVDEALERGDAASGAAVFAGAKSACLSCHRVGGRGGVIGPDLTKLAPRPSAEHLVESLLWPNRQVRPEYVSWQILTDDGHIVTGYKVRENEASVTLRDPASGEETVVVKDHIDAELQQGSPMPGDLAHALSRKQLRDLVRFLIEVTGNDAELPSELQHALHHGPGHGPARFPLDTAPLAPRRWSHAAHHVNRDRIYDFYTKQAEHFRTQDRVPMVLAPYPGLDGGKHSHWGNQNEQTWAAERWQQADLGTVQSGVFRGGGKTIARGICVRIGPNKNWAVCFNPDTLAYEVVWRDGFVSLSSVRHGFMHGLRLEGTVVQAPQTSAPDEPFVYHGYYRVGDRVVFAYRLGDTEYLDMPSIEEGRFARVRRLRDEHPMRDAVRGKDASALSARWPQRLETAIRPGRGRPFAIDTIELPEPNPWNVPLYCTGHDFLSDGSAMVSTMTGDVWHVSGLGDADSAGVARWRRFAAGLHQPLGVVVADGRVYVQCRDQLMRLSDLNGDGEADYYECFSNAFETSPAGHDFICGLERDEAGNFYTASGNQGLLRITADGRRADVLATGFRNSDGLGLTPEGLLTVPCSEGEWTPASMVCAVPLEAQTLAGDGSPGAALPHFGYRGPRDGQPPELPLVYLPRGLDNSSGGQTVVPKNHWGEMGGKLLHFSFGAGTWFMILQDRVGSQRQGAVVPLAGDFRSGVHRGRFSPHDGHLYVTGMQGWGAYVPEDGCFQRIRYRGEAVQMPIGFHVHRNGVRVDFTRPLDTDTAADTGSHFAQCWNYRYGGAYGSPEYSPMHPGVAGHDPLAIRSAHVLPDGRSLFLEIPDLQPVNQLHLRMHVDGSDRFVTAGRTAEGHDLLLTVHALDDDFENFPGYVRQEKTLAAHPILADMALGALRVPNPWLQPIEGARELTIETGTNLSYRTTEVRVRAGEPLAFTLANPDVVPHNWVLARPGSLQRVAAAANELIADPEAFARHYIPDSDDILCHTDIVEPGTEQTLYFTAPKAPGRYPFVCTFPGHAMVMNGVMIVE